MLYPAQTNDPSKHITFCKHIVLRKREMPKGIKTTENGGNGKDIDRYNYYFYDINAKVNHKNEYPHETKSSSGLSIVYPAT